MYSLKPETAMVAASMLLIAKCENKLLLEPVGDRIARYADCNAELLTRHLESVMIVREHHTDANEG